VDLARLPLPVDDEVDRLPALQVLAEVGPARLDLLGGRLRRPERPKPSMSRIEWVPDPALYLSNSRIDEVTKFRSGMRNFLTIVRYWRSWGSSRSGGLARIESW
jgi:hypothetical protein